jgi:hypothetical protein
LLEFDSIRFDSIRFDSIRFDSHPALAGVVAVELLAVELDRRKPCSPLDERQITVPVDVVGDLLRGGVARQLDV